jgi:hypothetical protein
MDKELLEKMADVDGMIRRGVAASKHFTPEQKAEYLFPTEAGKGRRRQVKAAHGKRKAEMLEDRG